MPIRTVFVPLSDAAGTAATLGTAFALAKSFNAHVDALHLRSDPTDSISDFVGETVSPALMEEVMEAAERRSAGIAKRTRKAFDDAVAKARVDLVTRPSAQGKASAAYQEETGLNDYWIETRGRVCDLIVVKRPRNSTDVIARSIAETALMAPGRPVLLAPQSAPPRLGVSVARGHRLERQHRGVEGGGRGDALPDAREERYRDFGGRGWRRRPQSGWAGPIPAVARGAGQGQCRQAPRRRYRQGGGGRDAPGQGLLQQDRLPHRRGLIEPRKCGLM